MSETKGAQDGWTIKHCVNCGSEYDFPPYGMSDEETCDTCGENLIYLAAPSPAEQPPVRCRGCHKTEAEHSDEETCFEPEPSPAQPGPKDESAWIKEKAEQEDGADVRAGVGWRRKAAQPAGAMSAEQWLGVHGLGDLSLHWPEGKPKPGIDYASNQTIPTLAEIMDAYASALQAENAGLKMELANITEELDVTVAARDKQQERLEAAEHESVEIEVDKDWWRREG